jgi:drug/metabolite transporter (DMT)-like permease
MDFIGIITAIFSALCMGTIGVFAKKTGLGAEVITFFRLGLGALFMLLLLVGCRQTKCLRCWPTWPVLVNGVMLAGFIIFYVQAMNFTTMANAIMLVYLAPPASAIYAHFFLRERLHLRGMFCIGLALFGFALMTEHNLDPGTGSRHLQGMVLGLLSTLCYTAFILINRTIAPRIHIYTRTFYQLLVGALIMLPLCLINRPDLPPRLWPWLAATGLIPGFFAILCAVIALSRLPAAMFGTLAYFEPIAVVIFGWALFAETLSWMQLSGCLLIMLGGIGMTCWPQPPPTPQPENLAC